MERTKIWSWVLTGTKTTKDCAGEDQQQFTALDWTTARGMAIGSTNEGTTEEYVKKLKEKIKIRKQRRKGRTAVGEGF
jgi:hypothetical protein